jgi:methionyl-tRNA formyltransferase
MPSGEELESSLRQLEINFISIEDIDSPSVSNFLADTNGWLLLSVGAPWIFKKSTLENIFRDELLNVHGTRLPTNRGGGGFSWQIMMGNRFGFTLIHKVDEGIDTGPIVAFEEFLYPHSCRTPRDFEKVYRIKSLDFIKMFISKARASDCTYDEIKQLEYLSTYWPRLNTGINGWINWDWSGVDIERFILAFDDPYGGAMTTLNGKVVHLKSVYLSPQDALFHPYQSGIVYRVSKNWICVAVQGSSLIIEGVADQSGIDLCSSIKPGDRFITPRDYLEKSVSRVVYTPSGLKTSN